MFVVFHIGLKSEEAIESLLDANDFPHSNQLLFIFLHLLLNDAFCLKGFWFVKLCKNGCHLLFFTFLHKNKNDGSSSLKQQKSREKTLL